MGADPCDRRRRIYARASRTPPIADAIAELVTMPAMGDAAAPDAPLISSPPIVRLMGSAANVRVESTDLIPERRLLIHGFGVGISGGARLLTCTDALSMRQR